MEDIWDIQYQISGLYYLHLKDSKKSYSFINKSTNMGFLGDSKSFGAVVRICQIHLFLWKLRKRNVATIKKKCMKQFHQLLIKIIKIL